VIVFQNAALYRGARELFSEASFTIQPFWRLGIIGQNGSGKSSLFSLLQGEMSVEYGEVTVPKHLTWAAVAQETPALLDSALTVTIAGDSEYIALIEKEKKLENTDAAALAAIHERLLQIDAYAITGRAAQLLRGLGFSESDLDKPVADFSGGWRMRINLARALMRRSDLLFLDEPTNHLDLDAILWLQDWLKQYPGTLLLISHDRDFLDSVCDHILHLKNKRLTLYTGNFSTFTEAYAERQAQQAAALEKQTAQKAHLESFVNRFRAKASKAKQAQSRLKMLEKMQVLAPIYQDSTLTFSFPEPKYLPEPLLTLEAADLGYTEPLLKNIELRLLPGQRLGLLGRNGSGKSTLIKAIAGVLPLLSGRSIRAERLQLAYFAQQQLEQLESEESAFWHIQMLDKKATEQSVRDYLGSFAFYGDQVFSRVGQFSGGERTRLVLAMLVYQAPNLLLLDEPTNHLDMETRFALEQALLQFQGAVVLVSHDRALLESTCEEFLLVDAGKVSPFAGDVDDYIQWLQKGTSNASALTESRSSLEKKPAESSRDYKQKKRQLEKDIEKIEKNLSKWQSELAALSEQLFAEENASNPGLLATLNQEKISLQAKIDQAENEWFNYQSLLEKL
jgi:ATP-binding cassette subfamily F protein 3